MSQGKGNTEAGNAGRNPGGGKRSERRGRRCLPSRVFLMKSQAQHPGRLTGTSFDQDSQQMTAVIQDREKEKSWGLA